MDDKLRQLGRCDDSIVEWAYASLRLLNKRSLRWLTVIQSYGHYGHKTDLHGDRPGDFYLHGAKVTLGRSVEVLVIEHEDVEVETRAFTGSGQRFVIYIPSIRSFAAIWCGARSRRDLAGELIGECGNFVTLKSIEVTKNLGVRWFKIIKELM